MIDSLLNDISYEYLKDTKLGENLRVAMDTYAKAQEALIANAYDKSSDVTKRLRIGTVLTFALLNKVANGKKIKEFNSNDWNEILSDVAEYAIIQGDERYSIAVFTAYANYVDASVIVLEQVGVSEDKCDAVKAIAEQVRILTDQFQKDQIKETDYTEECLWLLLEAMLKMLSLYATAKLNADTAEFIQSSTMLAFEYGRYKLYKREQEILSLYIENQGILDDELEEKLASYRLELEEQQNEFKTLMQDAFSSDFKLRLASTVDIARNIGVSDEELIENINDVDSFFN